MKIIKGKSGSKSRSGKSVDSTNKVYTAEEFIAEICSDGDVLALEPPSNPIPDGLSDSAARPTTRNVRPAQNDSSKIINADQDNSLRSAGFPVSELPEIESHGEKGSENQKAYNSLLAKGVRLLAMREHSEHEIRTKLLRSTDDLKQVDAVVDELKELKYLCDGRFTEAYIRFRSAKGFGPLKIRHELQNKGIDNNLIAEYLDLNSDHWSEVADAAYKRKFGQNPVLDYKQWAKQARYLQNRGFSTEHIHVVVPAVRNI